MQDAEWRGDHPATTTMALVAYVLHLVGAVVGLTSLIGIVIHYMKRHEGSALTDSHHAWMIRTFWWAIVWSIVGWLTWWFFFVGVVIGGLAWLWYIYRHVRGLLRLLDNQPMP